MVLNKFSKSGDLLENATPRFFELGLLQKKWALCWAAGATCALLRAQALAQFVCGQL
jgi:hypothetical protein